MNYTLGVRMAAMVKDFEFLEEFVKVYLNKLRPSAKENMKLYGDAYLNFARGDFAKALELTNKINFDLPTFKFELKNLQLILFYELNDYESLMYAIDSYRHFAANTRSLSEKMRNNIFRFINYINSLSKLRENPDSIKIELLKEKILDDFLNTKFWLLEKIEDLTR